VARAPLERPTDAPPIAHVADPATQETPGSGFADDTAQLVLPQELPRHVAIIMDGNRRWARSRGLSEIEGHAAGVEAIRSETAQLKAEGVRIRLLGRLDELPDETKRSITSALDETSGGERLLLNVAFNYAGRTEIVDAFRQLARSGVAPDEIDEHAISGAMYTAGLPDPDLVIRTGGEQRLSNFLIWQSAYAELYTCDVLWPDFGSEAFDAALLEFARRTRRFGR
jgi:undecaprenyl diphosphate synthase